MLQSELEMAKLTDVDLAYQLLRQNGQPKYYKDLIVDVLTLKGKFFASGVQGTLISGMYTEITMDSRFVHLGKGIWGLTEWYPQRGVPRFVEVSSEMKTTSTLRRDKALLAEIQETFENEDNVCDQEEKFEEMD
jgi:DNA-directed RNA polymerase subunit delta